MVLIPKIAAQIKSALQQNPQGLSITGIVRIVKISRSTAGRYLDTLLASGQVEMRRYGMAKIYSLAHRIPLSAVLSISSEFIMQLDNHLRILYVNEPFVKFLGTTRKDLMGKNIQFSPLEPVLDELFESFLKQVKNGIDGVEWNGELFLRQQKIIMACRVTPTAFENGRKGVSIIFEDITDRKRILEALNESEEIYSRIIETANEGICILDRNLHITFVNERFTDMLGYSPEEMVGHDLRDYIIDEDKVLMDTQIKLRRRGIKSNYEIRLMHMDGRTIWCLISGSPLLDNAGSFLGSFGMFTDITERRNAEKALQDSEEKYRSIIEALPDAVSVIDRDLKVIFANANLLSWMHILGLPTDIIGRTVPDAFPFLSPIILDEYRTVFWEGRIIVTQESSRIGDEEIVTETRKIPIKENDDIVAVVTIIRNITERRQAEDALQESEEKYRGVFSAEPDGICLVDQETGVIIECNDAFGLMHGYRKDELIGQPITALSAESDATRAAVTEGTPLIRNRCHKRKDGSVFPVDISVSVMSLGGRDVLIGALRDISDRKKVEQTLRESEAHLRTLINTIPDLVFFKDPEGVYRSCNRRFESLFGTGEKNIIGKTDYDFTTRKRADFFRRRDKAAIVAGVPTINEEEVTFAEDGHREVLETIKTPIYANDGQLIGVLGIGRNITERKRAEQIQRESEEKYRSLVETTRTGYVILDDSGNVLDANAEFVRISGHLELSEIVGHNVLEWTAECERDKNAAAVKQCLRDGFIRNFEINYTDTTGNITPVEINAAVVDDKGKHRIITLCRDISSLSSR